MRKTANPRSQTPAGPDRQNLRRRLVEARQEGEHFRALRARKAGAFDPPERRALRDRLQAARVANLRARLREVQR